MATASITTNQKLTFEQFLEHLPDADGRYELVNGEIVRILATRQHDDIADFIADALNNEAKRLQLNHRVSGRIMIRTHTPEGKEQGRQPDVSVVEKTIWLANRAAYSALFEPLQMAVEVISTNWEDDYIDKLDEYQRLGIPEYWIVDYLALGSRNYLGNPKVPTVFVYLLDENRVYQSTAFRANDTIVSRTFPEMVLTAEQIFQA
ncbi:Uma2 family endonuclease [Scytonema tolypothrichoides VB-61278]|nr:Uma2 family endonuclease [Scytonema tolypothrichoides VB-61278]